MATFRDDALQPDDALAGSRKITTGPLAPHCGLAHLLHLAR